MSLVAIPDVSQGAKIMLQADSCSVFSGGFRESASALAFMLPGLYCTINSYSDSLRYQFHKREDWFFSDFSHTSGL